MPVSPDELRRRVHLGADIWTGLKACKVCGADYVPRHCRALYCSRGCQQRARGRRRLRFGVRAPRTCPGCGRVFLPNALGRRRRFCHPKCKGAYRNAVLAARENPVDDIIRRRVTEALAAHPRGATVSEIARTANLPRYRVLSALEALGREGLAERAPVKAATGLGGPREVSGWKPAGNPPKRPRPALRGGLEGPAAG
jgi:hypothetical protein